MLTKIGEDGSRYEVKQVPNQTNYNMWVRKLGKENYENVKTWIEGAVEDKDKFFVGMIVPKIWDAPLISVYEATGENERDAALLLGRIVQHVLISHPREWWCAKTDMTNRSFAIAFYWVKA